MARTRTGAGILAAAFAAATLTSCSLLPTPGPGPTCGWTTSIPADGARLCAASYSLFRRLSAAASSGNDAAIHDLVPLPRVASRIIDYGRRIRSEGVRYLRPATTLLMTSKGRNLVLVSGDLKGRTARGKIDLEEVVLIRVDRRGARVVGDIPFEEW